MAIAAVLVLAMGIITAAVMTTHGGGSSDASPVPAVRPFVLSPVIAGRPSASLTASPGRPVVLTFFASWCAPCVDELPLLQKLSVRGDPAVVGVDEMDQRPDGSDLVRQAGVTFPAGFDHDGAVGQSYAINGLPINVFIAPDGRVVAYHRGQLDQHQLDGLVRRLLAAAP